MKSLEGNEPGGVGGSNTWPPMFHRLVGDGKFTQIMTHHLGLGKQKINNVNGGSKSIMHTNHALLYFTQYTIDYITRRGCVAVDSDNL